MFRSAVNAFSLALPAPGLAYLAAPSTNPLNAPQAPPAGAGPSFEEVGVNSAGLAVSATETTFHSNASLAADPLNLESGITEDDIPSIILPQARTAREAVQVSSTRAGVAEQAGAASGVRSRGAPRWMAGQTSAAVSAAEACRGSGGFCKATRHGACPTATAAGAAH